MNENQSRLKKSFVNITASVITGIIVGLLSMVRLRLFVMTFGDEVNGFFNLTASATATLNFVEAGLSTIFIQKMYSLFANREYGKIQHLYCMVKTIMKCVVLIMFGLTVVYGCLTIYQYQYLFGLTNTIWIYFLLMTPHVLSTYLNLPTCIARADQKGYLSTYMIQGGQACCYLAQMIVMLIFPKCQPLIMAAIIFVLTLLPVCICRKLIIRKYQMIFTSISIKSCEYSEIFSKMKDSFWGSLARSINLSLDNMMIAYLLPVANAVRLGYISILSIYNGVISFVKNIVVAIVTQVNASYGDLYNREPNAAARVYEIYFQLSCCITFVIYLSVYVVIEKFCVLFYGSNQIMEPLMLVLLIVNNILFVIKYVVTMVPVNVCGQFHLDRNVRVFEVLCNLILSYLLMQFFGVNGLFIGTLIAQVIVVTIYLRTGGLILNISWLNQVISFIIYTIVGCVATRLSFLTFEMFAMNTIVSWFLVSSLVFLEMSCIFLIFCVSYSKEIRRFVIELIRKFVS